MQKLIHAITGTLCCVLLSCGALAMRGPDAGPAAKAGPKHDCSFCHADAAPPGPGTLKKPLSALCSDCHPARLAPNEHKVDIAPAGDTGGLPLTNGRITCATCHDPHKDPYGKLLRKPAAKLCQTCHRV